MISISVERVCVIPKSDITLGVFVLGDRLGIFLYVVHLSQKGFSTVIDPIKILCGKQCKYDDMRQIVNQSTTILVLETQQKTKNKL